jgi:hypothetical protein
MRGLGATCSATPACRDWLAGVGAAGHPDRRKSTAGGDLP